MLLLIIQRLTVSESYERLWVHRLEATACFSLSLSSIGGGFKGQSRSHGTYFSFLFLQPCDLGSDIRLTIQNLRCRFRGLSSLLFGYVRTGCYTKQKNCWPVRTSQRSSCLERQHVILIPVYYPLLDMLSLQLGPVVSLESWANSCLSNAIVPCGSTFMRRECNSCMFPYSFLSSLRAVQICWQEWIVILLVKKK